MADELTRRRYSQMLLTQDRLHQAAGSRVVIDLRGRLDLVRCMTCSVALRRADFQDSLSTQRSRKLS
jgi:NAD-dependent SIR2 family protein deacetylase